MDDLSEGTVASEPGTNENRPDKQSGEELSACLKGTYWSRLPVEMQIEILKQKNLDDDDRLNLLCAYPDLLSVISRSYPRKNPTAANGGKNTEAESPPCISIKYSEEKKMFNIYMAEPFGSRQPRRIFGLRHYKFILLDLDSENKYTAILLNALESTSTTTRELCFSGTNKANSQLWSAFAKVLDTICLQLNFYSEQETTLNELVEALPILPELYELSVFGPVNADSDSLFSHLSKFPPSLYFRKKFFLHIGDFVKFFKTLVSTKFEEGSAAAVALKQIVNWKFEMNYETKTEEGETMNVHKFLSELVADIIPPNSEIVNLDSETGAVERRIFELHLAVDDEQYVIYVKEEIFSFNRCRKIQLANQTECLRSIQNSPNSSIASDVDEQMPSSDSDPDSEMVDSDEDEDYPDYDDFENDDH
ncbi:hypothetical protein WR25_17426 [Diploscapter pachys]|uniref:Uncharacterized protein n=1 Tax=Diploscapter pachys TaxID=2018661 RepID=A0A2A2JW28_9BILA|nr:hypothetical protein WR25_17426 [Diploscapter pachys]